MKPYDLPWLSANSRMLRPFSYCLLTSEASLLRSGPVILAPFLRSVTLTPLFELHRAFLASSPEDAKQ
ncbi:MAG: hypothetical protein JWN47_1367 [Frankiales bacterium]|nr:hypothetical protein [Frankiales bacterium]MDQ1690404.1 hypothetical protein [Pseudonocardiales bacterium]